MAEAFVYKWYNSQSKMCYIGRHKGTPDDGYIGSSFDFLDDYNSYPNNFKREILFVGTWDEVKKREVIEIRKAVEEHSLNYVYNKCSVAKSSLNIEEMTQARLYTYKKEIDKQSEELQSQLDNLRIIKSQINLELKKFSTKIKG